MMGFSNYSFKKKNILLLWGTLAVILILSFTVFSRTFDLYKENSQLNDKIEQAVNIPARKKSLKHKLALVNKRTQSFMIDSLRNREYLLFQVSEFCKKNSIRLTDFPQMSLETSEDYEVETNKIVAEGNFINLLKLLYELEEVKRSGRPSSTQFIKRFDNKTKKEVLSLIIYLQTLKLKKNEAI